ncbi:hypothetical protein G7Y89_g3836 [Cudoniella acicularis]|uniref:Uncharacterized protein n=1 Tax=Cudoniella acicularis TaxID=354080 RepID=A0A8H4W7A2_9HELO|nr:hypothetical protein G7Y89_g3836 [Cudoniella acicularis]
MASVMILLDSDLPTLCLVLRAPSLQLPHPIHEDEDNDTFLRIAMQIRFSNTIKTTKGDQHRLLNLLARANSVSKIQVINAADATVGAISPGYETTFSQLQLLGSSSTAFRTEKLHWFRSRRAKDADDYTFILRWLLNLEAKVSVIDNRELEDGRCRLANEFSKTCIKTIPSLRLDYFEPALLEMSEVRVFRAHVRVAELHISMRHLDSYACFEVPASDDGGICRWLDKEEVGHARALRLRILDHQSNKAGGQGQTSLSTSH